MNTKWFITRNHYLAVWDEYVPCNSWTGERDISDTLTYKIDILGRNKVNSYGLKPFRWSAKLCYNGLWFNVLSNHPSCKSIKDACQLADKALTDEVFSEACQFFLSRKFAHCIVDKNLNPFFTSFGPPRWMTSNFSYSKQNFPSGQYYYTHQIGNEIKFQQVNLSYHGYSGSGTDIRFEHWLI